MKMIRHLALAPIAAAALLVAAAAQAQTGPNPVEYQVTQYFKSATIDGTVMARFSGVDNLPDYGFFDTGITWNSLAFTGLINGTQRNLAYSQFGSDLFADEFSDWVIGDKNLVNDSGFGLFGTQDTGAPLAITWITGPRFGYNTFGESCAANSSGCGVLHIYSGTDAVAQAVANISQSYASVEVAPIPEPSTYLMMGFGLAALGFMARKRKSH